MDNQVYETLCNIIEDQRKTIKLLLKNIEELKDFTTIQQEYFYENNKLKVEPNNKIKVETKTLQSKKKCPSCVNHNPTGFCLVDCTKYSSYIARGCDNCANLESGVVCENCVHESLWEIIK